MGADLAGVVAAAAQDSEDGIAEGSFGRAVGAAAVDRPMAARRLIWCSRSGVKPRLVPLISTRVMGRFVDWDNYTHLPDDPQFTGSFAFTLTLTLALCSTALQLTLGLGLALLTVGEGLRRQLTQTPLMLPMVIAPVAVGPMWRSAQCGG